MKNLAACFVLSALSTGVAALAADSASTRDRMAPDTVLLKNGRRIPGLIVENTSNAVTIQTSISELTIPKDKILRILDVDNSSVYFAEMHRRGTLPPWRVIANDLRTYDQVRSFEEIPATMVDSGDLKYVPYRSFRINGNVEMNIYGDPDDPVAIELGIYGMMKSNRELQSMLRQFLAGYLTTREEISALYAIPRQGGIVQTRPLEISVTPPTAPDAFGAWWIGAANPEEVKKARLSPAEYARITRPMSEIVDENGNVRPTVWTEVDADLTKKKKRFANDAWVFLRGFYRDAKGRLGVLFDDANSDP